MRAYTLTVLVIDHDGLGPEAVNEELEAGRFGNDCIHPHVVRSDSHEIGEWTDDHPLNSHSTNLIEWLEKNAPGRRVK